MNIHKKKVERWYLFHDGSHNWDKYTDGHNPDGKSEYYLDFCNNCFKLKEYEAEKFRGQGTLCVPICKCESEEIEFTDKK